MYETIPQAHGAQAQLQAQVDYQSLLVRAQPTQGFRIPSAQEITAAIVQHEADEGADYDRVIREARKVIADAKGSIGKAPMGKKYQKQIDKLRTSLEVVLRSVRDHAHELTDDSDKVLTDLGLAISEASGALLGTLRPID